MDYENVITIVIGRFAIAFIVAGAFYLARLLTTDIKSSLKAYGLTLLICASIGFVQWATLGIHYEYSDDPIFGGIEREFMDFEPTDRERNGHAAAIFLSLGIPAVYGVYRGRKTKK